VKQLRADQALFRQAQAAAAKQGKRYTPDVLRLSAQIKKDNETITNLHIEADGFPTTFHCKPCTGPQLAFQVAACDAPDGSYWALQQCQRQLPDYGVKPTAKQAAQELHLSHWTGSLPVLTVETDWSYHKWEHLFGTFTYDGKPVFGSRPRRSGSRSTRSAAMSTSTRTTATTRAARARGCASTAG